MATEPRLRFRERPCIHGLNLASPLKPQDGSAWVPVVSCPAQFPLELFEFALMTLINHPEYNSTLILRTEIVSDEVVVHDAVENSTQTTSLLRYKPTRNIRRRLLPRRPGRDNVLQQDCTFHTSILEPTSFPSVLVLTPHIPESGTLPYYHPAVVHLAFRYISVESDPGSIVNHLIIEIDPLEKDASIDISSRIYRTCLSLLEALDRYGWGAMTNYQKRVIHDILVPRSEYQDLYIVMKERHKSLVNQWSEVTDPLKHVFEDIGIATFLMLLWRSTYSAKDAPALRLGESKKRPWDDWPRPPGGFVDFGCGNGVLTHILISEGYIGEGFDVRARASWANYPDETQLHLHVHTFTPSEPFAYIRASSFIIGNHADELTPWIPVLAALLPASGYISIPCCPWDFDSRYERGVTGAFHIPQFATKSEEHVAFVDGLGLGAEGQRKSSYSRYRIWLAYLSQACGWLIECEMLRIPSTRNWAIIGRSRTEDETSMEIASNIISTVLERGVFKARRPEGKGGH